MNDPLPRTEVRSAAALPIATTCCALALVAGCTPLDVNVGTEKPLDVDMSVNIHVYQFGQGEGEEDAEDRPEAAAPEEDGPDLATFKEAVARIEKREGQIWELKGSRLVGEARSGLLSIRNDSPSAWGEYSRKLVEEENKDREIIIEYEATRQGKTAEEIGRREWQKWRLRSNPGEWIEEEDKETGKARWARKKDPQSEEGDSD